MIINAQLIGNDIYLRSLKVSDATQDYISWLSDVKVNQYMETRHKTWSIDSVKDFIEMQNASSDQLLLGIFLRSGKHIGNIKIGPVNFIHSLADISIFIGDLSNQGKGYSTQAILLLKNYAFNEMGVKKLRAGLYADNIASLRTFLKAGFQIEGIFKNHYVLSNGNRTDVFQLGCFYKP